jgi:alanine dehydrogenase
MQTLVSAMNARGYETVGIHPYYSTGYNREAVYEALGFDKSSFMDDFEDAEYIEAGAEVIENAKDVWEQVEMMVKVKEPLPEEYGYFREGLILYTYFHLAADREQMDALLAGKVTAAASVRYPSQGRTL